MVPAMMTIVLTIVFLVTVIRYHPAYPVHTFENGWSVACGEDRWEDVSISGIQDVIQEKLPIRSVVEMEQELNVKTLPSPTLVLITKHYAAEVFLDGEKIGECAMDKYENGYVGGSRYFLSLPDDFAGKTLSIRYYAAEDGLTPRFYPVRLGAWHDVIWLMLQTYGYVLVAGVFLCFFGGFFLLFSMFFSVILPEIRGQGIASILSIDLGVWILSHCRVFTLFTRDSQTMMVEYISFYCALPLLYWLVGVVRKRGRLYHAAAAANSLAVVVFFILHFSGIMHLHRVRNVYYVMSVLFLCIVLYLSFSGLREGERTFIDILQMAGPVLFCSMVFISMIFYLRTSNIYIEDDPISVFIMTMGAVLFAMTRFLIYLWLLIENAPHRLEFSSLKQLAYTDALTGLANRTLMNELYAELDATAQDYCLISLDLNGLKQVNDTRGHGAGDVFLCTFAETLRAAFPADAVIMRTGGDEFLIVMRNADEKQIRTYLERMDDMLKEETQKSSGIIYSAASGYAFRHELKNAEAHSVFIEADSRMYARKRQMKAGQ